MDPDLVSVRMNTALDYDAAHEAELRSELRALLAQLGFDRANPMRSIVRPGDTVLLKPNLVFHAVSDPRAALTNGRLVKAVCDLVLEALGSRGRVIIGDVPLQSAVFDEVVHLSGLEAVVAEYRRNGKSVTLLDLRREYLRVADGIHRGVSPLAGD